MPNKQENSVTVVGAGLAGAEAAFQLAERGISVVLYDMKPGKMSPAHKSGLFSELVCSNSLRGAGLTTAPGLLKEELRRLGSLILRAADETAVPAGGALAVDRERFSSAVTERLRAHPRISIREEEVKEIPESPAIIATGPLTEGALAEAISALFGGEAPLSFYDAAAPIVTAESVDMGRAFFQSRYQKGTPDYINCPMTEDEYAAFVRELKNAEEAPVHGFEDAKVFEGCMPVEVMARRGEDTLRYGPLKPVGILDPATGRRPYAVVQLRRDNREGTLFNLVGFQTHLKFGEQKRVFSMIPALADAEFVRYGVMHRNTFLDSPKLLSPRYEMRTRRGLYFAGQMTGVEGYIESAASGYCAALHLARALRGMPELSLPPETAMGALAAYVGGGAASDFQPMNINFGIIAPLHMEGKKLKKRDRYEKISERSLAWMEENRSEIMR